MIKVTPSGIGTLLECPRCLWLLVNEDKKRPRGIFPSLPDGMDNVFKKYFDEYRSRGELPPEIRGKVEGQLFDDVTRLSAWRESNFGRGGIRAQFPEYDIDLGGAIDELLVSPRGRFIPFDFKTRGYPIKEDSHEHYRHQLDLYALLFEKNNLPPEDFGYLLFFWPSKFAQSTAQFKTEVVKMSVSSDRARSILKQVHEIVTGPKPLAHRSCEYCIYREA